MKQGSPGRGIQGIKAEKPIVFVLERAEVTCSKVCPFLAHSQIIGDHLENLQNTDNWGKMLDNGSLILFFFSPPVLSYLLLICVVSCFDDQAKIPFKNPRESALVQVNFS